MLLCRERYNAFSDGSRTVLFSNGENMSIDRRRSGIWQDANSNQSIASRRDYRMNNQKSPLHGAALRAARSGRLLLRVGGREITEGEK